MYIKYTQFRQILFLNKKKYFVLNSCFIVYNSIQKLG